MEKNRKWLRIGRISLLFPLAGLGMLFLVIFSYNNPNDWHGIGRVVYGFGAFTALSLVGGVLGIITLTRQFSIAALISLIIAVGTLLFFGHILSQ